MGLIAARLDIDAAPDHPEDAMPAAARPSVPRFDRAFLAAEETFTRIGGGSLGGKAAGLLRIKQDILPALDHDAYPLTDVVVPTLTVLTTEVFESFMAENRLWELALSDRPDDRIAHAFQRASLPAQVVGDLRALIAAVHTPLAVRSSSLLEDTLRHPFAGVYGTKMIPNNEIDVDARFRRLVDAIRFVYASTYSAQAKAYATSIGRDPADERMAVIVQEVVGQRSGHRFYPCVSGVARSFNSYPAGAAKPEEGVVSLALGLGKTIVDGEPSWSYVPGWPKSPPPFNDLGELLKNTQTRFWAVNMGPPPLPDPMRETECLERGDLVDAERDDALRHLASTYDAGADRLYPGTGSTGPRALTFAPLLGSRLMPFNEIVRDLLGVSRQVLDSHVELEFAVRLDRRDGLPARFACLQVRPMMGPGERVLVEADDLDGADVLVASEDVLGNGRREDIRDVVYVDPDTFDPSMSRQAAAAIERVNRELVEGGRPSLLVGFGRWGTSDPSAGIPVAWGQISSAGVIVEATMPGVRPELSQGSHFFHNLLGLQVLYLSVPYGGRRGVDWGWLTAQPATRHPAAVRHLQLDRPLVVRVDGVARRGVVRRP